MDIFFEIHCDLPREGPGSDESTQRAFHLIPQRMAHPQILDIGCGPGMQTITLAKLSQGNILALDNHQPFLDTLEKKAQAENLSIQTIRGSMFDLPFSPESFDLIWSEGAIYIMGFENGLKSWRNFLRKDGYLAVTEASWLKADAPLEVLSFWQTAYPAMNFIATNIDIIERCGYRCLDHFILPESDWWNHYYGPLEKRLECLRQKYTGNPEALKALDEEKVEIDLYRKYCEYYGYVFYIMQKIERS